MCFKNDNNLCCCLITVISAVIGAIGVSASFYAGLLTSITGLIIATLVLGGIGLLYLIINLFCGENNCKTLNKLCILPIIVGSIITSIVALVIGTIPTSSISAGLLVLAIVFFFIMSIINVLEFVFSLFCSKDKYDNC